MKQHHQYDESVTLFQATEYIRRITRLFPFADWYQIERAASEWFPEGKVMQSRSLAVHVAAMLSQFCVGLLPPICNRMGFIYNANSQRSGKTLLAKMAVMPLYGRFKAQSWKTDEVELSKVIDAEVLAGSTYICFDNVRGYIGNQALEGLMTSPDWTGRVLGRTEMFTAPNRTTLFVTGNDIIVSPDMGHRCLICDLFVQEGDVQERAIPLKDLIDEEWLCRTENRLSILSALWAIVRHWHAAGMPTASSYGFKPRLGFEKWGEIIGGMVGFAGFGDPLARVEIENAGDNVEKNLRRLLQALNEERMDPKLDDTAVAGAARREFRFQDLVDICHTEGIFEWMLNGQREASGSFRLKSDACSKLGTQFMRFAPSADGREKSRTYRIANKYAKAGDKPTIVMRFFSKGEGRHKRYVFETVE